MLEASPHHESRAHICSEGRQKLVAWLLVLGHRVPPGLGHVEAVEVAEVAEVAEEAKVEEEESDDLMSGSHSCCYSG